MTAQPVFFCLDMPLYLEVLQIFALKHLNILGFIEVVQHDFSSKIPSGFI